ncbi:hypothetical protein I3842_05G167400 [Carya illinoinensis]|uniref:Reverse transcriptase zinc-binding domain-containing protein n=1 Tax=Carya illinoinensis TaxID=32201 RepID=A0A922F3P7_CARIL|nr:hypothetical protein I3842_05G167400 [Carya illinoinensis]
MLNLVLSPSHIWRNIWSSISLIKEIVVWRVGNGHSIRVWHDKWLPKPTTYKVQTPINRLSTDSTVVELIDIASARWKTNLKMEVFSSEEAQLICSIPISSRDVDDKLIWAKSTKGVFSVKSACFLDCSLTKQYVGETSNGETVDVIWRKIWHLKVPGKFKQFIWKTLNDILPTKQLLRKKQIMDDGLCPICQHSKEPIIHVLWTCPTSMDV